MDVTVNGKKWVYSGDPDMPLLWFLREELELVGTKFGCGIASCGACTVHQDGVAVRSCSIPMAAAAGTKITTIEGLAKGGKLHPVQQAWLEEDVAQCGYCQAGQIMAAVDLLKTNGNPSDDEIDAAISNLCRCGSYPRIRKAVHRAVALAKG
jgi:isoquinoline 1-oxidoreductase subunit alpha